MSMSKIGVYAIRNKINTKLYIGSAAVAIRLRLNRHRYLLRHNIHNNRHLQAAWNKYGECAFEFIVVEECLPENCLILEQYYIDHYDTSNPINGYNLSPTAGNTLGTTLSHETKIKMSAAQKGKKKSAEHAAKVAEANKGKKRSDESRAKMSEIGKIRGFPKETLEKAIASNIGRKLSEEHKTKLSIAAKNRSPDCYKKMWESRRKTSSDNVKERE